MAETLAVTGGDGATLLGQAFEPLRKNQWVLEIDGVDAYLMKTAGRPNKTTEEIVIDWLNQKRYLAAKSTWNDLAVTLYDPISPSAAQQVLEWARLVHEDVTGRAGYAEMYKRTIDLKMVDPMGTVVQHWQLEGAWPKEVNFGDLDYSTGEPTEISLTIRYDRAINLF